jgi:hypothetical protein
MKVELKEAVTIGGVTWGPGVYETNGLDEPWKSELEKLVRGTVGSDGADKPQRSQTSPEDK